MPCTPQCPDISSPSQHPTLLPPLLPPTPPTWALFQSPTPFTPYASPLSAPTTEVAAAPPQILFSPVLPPVACLSSLDTLPPPLHTSWPDLVFPSLTGPLKPPGLPSHTHLVPQHPPFPSPSLETAPDTLPLSPFACSTRHISSHPGTFLHVPPHMWVAGLPPVGTRPCPSRAAPTGTSAASIPPSSPSSSSTPITRPDPLQGLPHTLQSHPPSPQAVPPPA